MPCLCAETILWSTAISPRDSKIKPEPAAMPFEGSETEVRCKKNGVFFSTVTEKGKFHQFGALTHQIGGTSHQIGGTSHQIGETSHRFGETSHRFGGTSHRFGGTSHRHGALTHQNGAITHHGGEKRVKTERI